MQFDPPEWVNSWITFVTVQIVSLFTIGIAIWRWLTKPFRDEGRKNTRRIIALKRIFRKESFDIRTEATNIMGMIVKADHRINHLEHVIENLTNSTNKIQKTLDVGLLEIRDRLTAVETELQIRFEKPKDRH